MAGDQGHTECPSWRAHCRPARSNSRAGRENGGWCQRSSICNRHALKQETLATQQYNLTHELAGHVEQHCIVTACGDERQCERATVELCEREGHLRQPCQASNA